MSKVNASKKWLFKGNVSVAKLDFDEALNCFNRAIQTDPTNLNAHIEKGNVFLNQRKFSEAVDAYKKCFDYKADFPNAIINIGSVLSHQGM